MKGIRILAVLVGLIVDLVLSLVSGLLFAIALGLYLATSNHSHPFAPTTFDQMAHSTPALLLSTVIGAITSFIGGALTSWLAKTDRMKNVITLAVVELVVTLPFFPYMGAYPLWFSLGGSLVAVIFILWGGYTSCLIFDDKGSRALRVSPLS